MDLHVDNAGAFEYLARESSMMQALRNAAGDLNNVQFFRTLVLEFQKAVKRERRQPPKSRDNIGDIVAENDGMVSAKLREHVVAEDSRARLRDGKRAHASIGVVDDVKGTKRFGRSVVRAYFVGTVAASGVYLKQKRGSQPRLSCD